MNRRAWIWYLVGGFIAIGGHFAVSGQLQARLYEAIGLSSMIVIAVGIHHYRPRPQIAWWLLFAGQGLFFAGDVAWDFYQDVLHVALPSPSFADALYVAGYPCLMLGLWIMIRSLHARGSREGIIDASIVAAGCGALVWFFVVNPYEGNLTPTAIVAILYPTMDVLLLGALARLLFAPGARSTALRLLVASMISLMAGDILYAVMLAHDSGTLAGSPWSIGWIASYVLLGTAALHPSMHTAFDQASDAQSGQLSRGRMLLLGGIAFIPMLSYASRRVAGVPVDIPEVVISSAVLFALVLGRMSGLLRQLLSSNRELDRLQGERGALLAQLVQAGEDERKRLSADLHDGSVQKLSAMVLMAGQARTLFGRGDTGKGVEVLDRVRDGLSAEVTSLRRTMAGLRPPALDEGGLVEAIADHAAHLGERNHIRCSVESRLEARLEPLLETALYRVAQEALTNVAKHADAQNVWVKLGRQNGSIRLQVRDDGRGFEGTVAPLPGSGDQVGLATMRERVGALGGSLVLTSVLGGGTLLEVTVPVPSEVTVPVPS
jgi:signal transduction histidine kinase